MKILILTAFWQRPVISQLYWHGIERLRKNFDIKVLSVISDPDNKTLAEKYSDFVFEHENYPLGRKMNAALAAAVAHDFDYLMQLGSDDLITDFAVKKTQQYFSNGFKFFGFNKTLIVDSETKKSKEYYYGNVFGSGRCISRDLIDPMGEVTVRMKESISGPNFNYGKGAVVTLRKKEAKRWEAKGVCEFVLKQNNKLWVDEINSGLDRSSEKSIEEMGYIAVPIETKEPECIDVKSAVNLWPYSGFKVPEKDIEFLRDKISQKEFEYIMSL